MAERRRTHQGVGILVIVGLGVLAMAGGVIFLRSQARSGAVSSPVTPPAANVPSRLKAAPNFPITLYQGAETLGGDHIVLANLLGKGKPVVLNFWAGLCLPCRQEMPDLQNLYNSTAKGKWTLIGVDIGPHVGLGSREDGKALLHDFHISFPAGTTFEEDVIYVYQIIGMPTTVFITPEGRIFKVHPGLLTPTQMNTLLRDLLQASGIR